MSRNEPIKMSEKPRKYGGAETNVRLIAIREALGLSRAELARLTGYSHQYVDNWLSPRTSKQWREAPENAARLAELETGRRRPAWTVAKLEKQRSKGHARHQ